MDVLTIIWYFSTFLLLILFFVVMVCSDNFCNRRQNKPEDIVITAPPTPAPSYSEFAPPGYNTVMKKYKNRIFIVPVENGTEPGIFAPRDMQSTSPISSAVPSPVQSRISVHVPQTVPEIIELPVTSVESERRRSSSVASPAPPAVRRENSVGGRSESISMTECEAVNVPVIVTVKDNKVGCPRTTKNSVDDSRASSG